ncbi:cytochrome c biogenesis CcdA family protein [Magnetospira sp. QH-2]|uniref:cytochrome c biogenesis CcdA family protein n=1 Tax=Magnetospira sp. (strain QH-2) TaxID=1288970 RepID=UPI0003E81BB9|nr:cytochrome c biogenesis CcdA family protein [Magnetospira sp. QH-2]CCQ73756.1 Cytochrome c biogenesis protein, transmembrane region [Magnetospira sp. QH-2]
MGMDVSYGTAMVAGILTFLAPCILPLVPAYLSFISGASLEDLTDADSKQRSETTRRALISGLFFVLGLSFVFVSLGAGATTIGGFMGQHKREFAIFGAILIIIFGLHYMGLFKIGFLNFEKRFHLENKPAGVIGAFLIGMAFGFGWTPCVGPVLSTILMQAAMGESIWDGIILLSIYSAGLGIPFLLAAAFASRFMLFLAKFRRHLGKIEMALGGLLVLTGVLILTGGLNSISNWILEAFPALQKLS